MYFHLYCKSRCFWRNLHRWQKFYTAAGSDGMNKSHLCLKLCQEGHLKTISFHISLSICFKNQKASHHQIPVRHQISSLPGTPLENIRSEMSAAGRKDPLLNNPKAKMYPIELARQSHPLGLAGRRMALA